MCRTSGQGPGRSHVARLDLVERRGRDDRATTWRLDDLTVADVHGNVPDAGDRAVPAPEDEVARLESVQCRLEAARLAVLVGSEVVQQRPWRQRVQHQAGAVEADTLAVIA